MIKSKKAIVTSLSDLLIDSINIEQNLKKALERFALQLESTTGTKVDFCKRHGRRWSYFAGYSGLVVPEKRIEINSAWGLIIENNMYTTQEWTSFAAILPD